MAREVALTVPVARHRGGVGGWVLGAALIAVPVLAALPLLRGDGLAAGGVIGGVALFEDWRGVIVGWVAEVVLTIVAVRTLGARR